MSVSYYVYISRRTSPLDDSGLEIAAAEWTRFIESETDFRTPAEGEFSWINQHDRVWTGYIHPMMFAWSGGQVEVKNPNLPALARMRQLADQLSAKVFSETGEIYDESGNHAGFLPDFP